MARFVEVKVAGAKDAKRYPLKKNTSVKVKGADWVTVVTERADISAMEQNGADLIIRFTDGTYTRLEGYFDCSADDRARLTIADPVQKESLAVTFANGVCDAGAGTTNTLEYSLAPGGDPYVSGFLPVAGGIGLAPLLGLGAVGVGGAAAAGGGGDGGGGGGGTTPDDQTPPAAPVVEPTNGSQIKGTAEAGSNVAIDLDGNGTTDATVPVDGNGNWTYTPTVPVPDGTTVIVDATDPAGNTSPPTSVVVDGATPTPTITSVTDDVSPVTGVVADGGRTDDRLPTIEGSGAEANATIAIFDGDTQIGTTQADAAGNWSFTPTEALGEGDHSFSVRATDALGNVSGPSNLYDVTIGADGGTGDDTTPPLAPAIGNVTDDVAPVVGDVADDGSTNDTRPTLTGTAEPGATVTIFDGTTQLGTATANGSGDWTFTPSDALPAGAHAFTATATDAAGNTGPASNAYDVTITDSDTTPPVAPVIGNVIDDVAPTTGNVADGGSTDDTRPTLTGTAEPGATVTIFDGTTQLGTATANGSGNWTFTPSSALPVGAHAFTATATDAAGNTGPASNVYDVTIAADDSGGDTTPPAAPIISSVVDDVARATGTIADGGSTDDTRPTLTGTAEPGATVTIFDGTTQLGTATANGSGNWTFTPSSALPIGAHAFTATATDAAGNTGPASSAYDITIAADGGGGVDTTPPLAPVISSVTDDVVPATGNVPDGGSTNDTQPTLTGTAEGGATVTIFDGVTPLGTATANGSGNWTFTPPSALPAGDHAFTARATDAAGNTGPASIAYDVTITVDSADVPATIDGEPSGTGAEDTVITGTLTATDPDGLSDGAYFTVSVDPTNGTAAIDEASGAWTYTPAANFNGNDSFTVTVTDDLGGTTTQVIAVTVTPVDDPAIIGGETTGIGVEDTEITGTLTATDPDGLADGSYFTVSVAATNGSAAIDEATGEWTYTPAANFTGSDSFTVMVTDDLGGTTTLTIAVAVTPADDTPGTIGGMTSGTGVEDTEITGTLTATDPDGLTDGTYFTVSDPATSGTAVIDAETGEWTYTPDPDFNGMDSFIVRVTDDEGGITAQTISVIVTPLDDPTTIGGATTGSGPEDTAVTGTLTATDPDGLADGSYFTVTGAATNGDATIDEETGAWTYTPAADFNGTDSFTVTVTDDTGIATIQEILVTVTPTDDPTTVGGATTGTGAEDTPITGTLTATDPDGLTDGSYFTVTGPAANGSATIDEETGEWTYTPAADFNGTDSFTVTVTDDEGAATTQTILVTVTPTDDPTTIGGAITGSGPEDTAITGTLTATDPDGLADGSYFTVTGAPTNGDATIDGETGAWTYTPAADFNGTDNFTVTVTDDEGTATTQTISVTVTPVNDPTTIGGATTGTGAEDTPITGTLTATDPDGLADGSYFIVTGPAANGSATIDEETGEWTYTPAADFNGTDSFTVTVTDDEGVATTQTILVTVTPVDDPTTIGGAITGSGPEDTAITGTLTATDPDGLADGSYFTVTGAPTNGDATIDEETGVWTYTPAADFNGTDNFTVTVTDDEGTATTQTISVTVTPVNDPTTIGGATTGTGAEDTPITGTLTASDLDGLDDDSYFTVTGAAANGSATIDGETGEWTYTPAANFNGTDSFTVTVMDDAGGITTQAITVTVTPVDDPTVIGGAITGSGAEDTTITGTLTATDPDGLTDGTYFTVTDDATDGIAEIDAATGAWTYTPAEGFTGTDSFTVTVTDDEEGTATQTITVTVTPADDNPATIGGATSGSGPEDTEITGTLTATDPDGLTDGTYFTVTGAAANGSATIDGETGEWTYTPAANFNGTDSFTVTVTDDGGAATTQTISVTVTPVDDPTVFGGAITGSGAEDTAITGTLTATDPDGLTDGNYFAVTGGAANGDATIDEETGAWTYTPAANFFGSDSFTVTVTDDEGTATTQTISVTVSPVDDPTTFGGATSGTGPEDTEIIGTLTATDPDGLTDGSYFVVTGAAANGTADIDVETGEWTYTPAANFNGTDSFTVTVTDDRGGSATQTISVTVTPVDDPTVFGGAITGSGAEDTAITGTLTATDPDGLTDGNYFAVTGGAANGTADIDVETGAWTYTPAANFFGSDSFTVTVTDDEGTATTQSISVTVSPVDDPTTFGGATSGTGPEDTEIIGTLTATDPDGLTDGSYFVVTGAAANGTADIDVETGEWTYTPAANFTGSDSFTVTVTDDRGGSATQTISVTVTPVDDPTVFGGAITGSGAEDTAITGTLTATDPDGLTDGNYFTVSDPATNGTAVINAATGAWTYTPAANFFGNDSFVVTVTDDAGDTTSQTVSVTVTPVDDPTTFGGATTGTGPEETEITGTLTATDPDGLTDGSYFLVTGAAANGTADIDVETGEWTYTPTAGFTGSDSFTVTVTDDQGGSATQMIAVTVTEVDTLEAVNDTAAIQTGSLVANAGAVLSDADTQVLGLLDSTYNADNSASVTIPGDYPGELRVTVSQTALLAVADAFRLDIYDGGGALVYSAYTPDSLVGDVAGLPVLGVVNDNTLVATVTGLAPGTYTVVVRNDQSTLGGLLDTDGDGISLQELDGSGLVLGAENEGIILDVVEATLNGSALGLPLNIGTVIRGLLDPLLGPLYGLPVSEIVSAVSGLLDSQLINLPGVLDAVVDAVADNLLSNTLTLLQTTTITTQFTEYDFANETAAGNVITGGVGGVGADDITVTGGEVTQVSSTNGNLEVIASGGSATIVGVHGELTIDSDGAYTYTAYGDPDSVGQSEVFTYTLSDGALSDTATLTIAIADTAAPVASASITAIVDNTGTPSDWATNDTSPTIQGTLSAALAADERVQVQVDGGAWVDATADGTDWFFGPGGLSLGGHTIAVRTIDATGNTTVANNDTQPISITNTNAAPIAIAAGGGLLGLVGADALGLIEIGAQAFVAFDPNNNLNEVVVAYDPVLTLGSQMLTFSSAVANELGLSVDVDFLGLTTVSTLLSRLTITNTAGGSMDNLSVNELLKTVHFDANLLGLSGGAAVSLLSATTIEASDGTLSDNDTVPTALGVSLLNNLLSGSGDPTVIQGNGLGNTLNGTAAAETIYGFAGADVLNGGGGNDLLRGGAGADTLDGGTGDDLLIYDSADVLINGGAGFDTVLVESGATFSLANLQGIEQVRVADQAVTATLDADAIIAATGADNRLIVSGGSNVSLTLNGASYDGQVLFDDRAYEQYTMGLATILIEDPIVINVVL